MIAILVALANEVPSLKLDPQRFQLIFTGVGKINASLACAKIASDPAYREIINYGTAGVLRPDLAGRLHQISVVRQRDMDGRPMAPLGTTPFEKTDLAGDIQLPGGEGVTLSTGDQFVSTPPELQSDMVDMEGYAIAKIARSYDKPVRLLKFGSDFADENATQNWRENVEKGAVLFADWLAAHYDMAS